MKSREERGASRSGRRFERSCLTAEQAGERQRDVCAGLQERAGEVRRAPRSVERIRTRSAARSGRRESISLHRDSQGSVLVEQGRGMRVRRGVAVSMRPIRVALGHEERDRRVLTAALVRVIVPVEAEVQAGQEEHQREVKDRGERRPGLPVPVRCATG